MYNNKKKAEAQYALEVIWLQDSVQGCRTHDAGRLTVFFQGNTFLQFILKVCREVADQRRMSVDDAEQISYICRHNV